MKTTFVNSHNHLISSPVHLNIIVLITGKCSLFPVFIYLLVPAQMIDHCPGQRHQNHTEHGHTDQITDPVFAGIAASMLPYPVKHQIYASQDNQAGDNRGDNHADGKGKCNGK